MRFRGDAVATAHRPLLRCRGQGVFRVWVLGFRVGGVLLSFWSLLDDHSIPSFCDVLLDCLLSRVQQGALSRVCRVVLLKSLTEIVVAS